MHWNSYNIGDGGVHATYVLEAVFNVVEEPDDMGPVLEVVEGSGCLLGVVGRCTMAVVEGMLCVCCVLEAAESLLYVLEVVKGLWHVP